MALTPRPGILDVETYAGGAAHAAGFAEPIRLASNENPLGASPRAAEAYAAVASDLHHYPDGAAVELTNFTDGVHYMRVTDAVYRSRTEGRAVDIDEVYTKLTNRSQLK